MKNIKKTKMYFNLKNEIFAAVRKINPNFRRLVEPVGQGSIDSRYCYSVFMRHIVHLFKNGMNQIPESVAEFGPGNSLGTGICAILAGARKYYALDFVKYADNTHNLKVLNELITLFKEKAPIPDEKEFPDVQPLLDDYSFPTHIFSDKSMRENLSDKRIELIKNALSGESSEIVIKYIVPWENYSGKYPNVDFIFSQAVLEHIDNLERFYKITSEIITKGGFVSHDIDFRSHDETYEWNGHWAISEKKWAKIRGTRAFLINREPLSTHLNLLKENGFQIIEKIPIKENSPSIKRKELTSKYKYLSDSDFETSTCYIIAKKI